MRGCVAFNVVAVDSNGALVPGDHSGDYAPPSEKDYSVAALLRFGTFDYLVGGDFDR